MARKSRNVQKCMPVPKTLSPGHETSLILLSGKTPALGFQSLQQESTSAVLTAASVGSGTGPGPPPTY